MSNWGTAVAIIRTRAKKSSSEDTRIKIALCDFIALHRGDRLKWSQAWLAKTLTLDTATYDLGSSVVSLLGDRGWILRDGVADDRWPVDKISRSEMERYRSSLAISGVPSYWSYWDERLELYPASDSSSHVFRIPYVADVGTPYYTATTADPPVFTFKQPDGTAMADSFTNAWFDPLLGFQCTVYGALYKLWAEVWEADAGQDTKAQMAFAEALALAEDLTSLQQLPHRVDPWGFE